MLAYQEDCMSKAKNRPVADATPAPVVNPVGFEPVTPKRDDGVAAMIHAADLAAKNMLQQVKEAAACAAKQLDAAKALPDRIAAVVSLYAVDFAQVDHNIKALFVDALTLHAAAMAPVTVLTKEGEKHITAGEAVALPKHAMRDAAKQVREQNNMGRKSGGGRKAAAAKVEEVQKAVGPAPDMTVSKSEIDKFGEWLDSLGEYLNDAVYHPRIVAALIAAGYRLDKAAKGQAVQGKASA